MTEDFIEQYGGAPKLPGKAQAKATGRTGNARRELGGARTPRAIGPTGR